ncbi:MAG: T9SS type A sorting domain-containing protein [Ignavibacteriota bacterium]
MSQVLISGHVFAQPKIDSIRIQVNNLEVDYSYHHDDGHGNSSTSKSVDTISPSLHFIVATSSLSGDTLLLKNKQNNNCYIKIIYDSLTNFIDSFYYFSLDNWGVSGHASTELVFEHSWLKPSMNMLGIDLNSSEMVAGKFWYNYYGAGKDGTGSASGDERIVSKRILPSSSVTVYLYGVMPSNSVLIDVGEKNKFHFFPNPATRVINLVGDFSGAIYITNQIGVEVAQLISNQQNQLDVSSLPPGIYYLRAGDQMQKFVIQR